MALVRMATVSTPVSDSLHLFRMQGREELGRPFEYELELLSTDSGLTGSRLLGQGMTVQLEQEGGRTRHIHGIVARFERGCGHGRYAAYEVTLRPNLWLLSRTADCRISPHATVPAVIAEVLRDHGVDDLRSDLLSEYESIDYQVQYRETALDFVTRLMERAGIYYYFRHEHKKHTLVLSDGQHEPAPNHAEVPYYPPDPSHERESEHLDRFWVAEGIQPGAYALSAFDFEKPRANLAVRSAGPLDHGHATFEHHDYPGDYRAVSHGEGKSRIRLEALHAQQREVRAEGSTRGLSTGSLFTLTGFPDADQNKQYLVTSETIVLENNGFESGDWGTVKFRSAITAIDAKTPFRLPPRTRSPIISGPQTAIVVGPKGEEIWTDQYGRVKVQFHWDGSASPTERTRAGCAWRRSGRARAGARCTSRASARRSSSSSSRATRTSRSSPAASTTPTTCRPTVCPRTRPRAGSRAAARKTAPGELQRAALRGQEGRRRDVPARREEPQRAGQERPHHPRRREIKPTPSAKTRARPWAATSR